MPLPGPINLKTDSRSTAFDQPRESLAVACRASAAASFSLLVGPTWAEKCMPRRRQGAPRTGLGRGCTVCTSSALLKGCVSRQNTYAGVEDGVESKGPAVVEPASRTNLHYLYSEHGCKVRNSIETRCGLGSGGSSTSSQPLSETCFLHRIHHSLVPGS